MNEPPPAVEAFILAGGRASRFGSDKALAVWRGRTLLEHALRAIKPLGLPTRVVTPNPDPYRPWIDAFVVSERPGLGPVEGVRAALGAAVAPWALLLTVDMPGVGPLLAPLIRAANSVGHEVNSISYEDDAERWQPFPGLYRNILASRIAELGPGASMHALREVAHAHVLAPHDVPEITDWSAALRNVNEPGDLT